MTEFEPVIGLEVHAQINTDTKLFCRCSNNSFGKEPNINICPICTGHPGQLPVINEAAVKKGLIAGIALNCKIPNFSKFDRKNYFYPDLPSGFQISQFDKPVAEKGSLKIDVEGKKVNIGITRLHLENDAGKLTHTSSGTLCDYNRAGSPLMEIVSEPDLRSSKEAVAYAKELQKILRYVGSSDADMEKGMMRFDINVSVRPKGDQKLGTRSEVKNLNSFRSLEKSIEYEIKRQIELINGGGKVVQETRGFDESTDTTVSQRGKEEAHDYRYFPEPDLPPFEFTDEEINELRTQIPELPAARKARFVDDLGIKVDDAVILCDDKTLGDYFEKVASGSKNATKAASLITSVIIGLMNRDCKNLDELNISAEALILLMKKIDDGELSSSAVKTVLDEMYESGKDPEEIIKEKNLVQMSDQGELENICKTIVESNEQSVLDYKNGKDRAFGFLVGQVMKETKGKANPGKVNEILIKLLK